MSEVHADREALWRDDSAELRLAREFLVPVNRIGIVQGHDPTAHVGGRAGHPELAAADGLPHTGVDVTQIELHLTVFDVSSGHIEYSSSNKTIPGYCTGLSCAAAQLGKQGFQPISPQMQWMLEGYPHPTQHLVNVVHDLCRAVLSMQRGHCGIRVLGSPCGFESEPADAASHNGALGQPMADCLEGGERPAELLAIVDMLDGCRDRGMEEAGDFRGERDPQPFAYVCCVCG